MPTYELRAEVPSAANLVVGNDVRIGGSRVGFVSGIEAKRRDDGSTIAVLDLSLERDASPLPRDSTLIVRPRSALGLKYVEITRGSDERGLRRRRHDPACRRHARARRVRRGAEHVRRRDARGRRDQHHRLRRRVRGPRRVDQHGHRRVPAAAARHHSGSPEPVLARHQPAPLRARAGRRRRDRGAGRRDAGRAVRQPRHDVRRARARSRGRTSRTRSPAAARRSTPRSATFPIQRPFLRNTEGLFRELRPGAAALRTSAPTIADALVEGTRVLPRTAAVQPAPAVAARGVADVRRGPDGAARPARDHRRPAVARPDARVPDARADGLQLRDAVVPQRRLAAQRGRPQRHLAALHHHRDAPGPEQRGRPVDRARRTGPTEDNHLHTNPYPNTASPGQPRECEAGNEPFIAGRTVLGNVRGPSARDRRTGDAADAPRGRRRTPPPRDRPDRARRARRARVPRLHQGHPVHAARSRSTRCSSRRTRSGRARRSGSRASTSARSGDRAARGHRRGRVVDADRRRGAAASTPTPRRRSGRGSSSRATSSSTSARARPSAPELERRRHARRSRRPPRRCSSTRC